MMDIKP